MVIITEQLMNPIYNLHIMITVNVVISYRDKINGTSVLFSVELNRDGASLFITFPWFKCMRVNAHEGSMSVKTVSDSC